MDEKKIAVDSYKAKIKQGITENGEKCFMDIEVNPDLRDLIKSAVIPTGESVSFQVFSANHKRYKVKGVIYNSLNVSQVFKDILFSREVIDAGKSRFEFVNTNDLKSYKEGMNSAILEIIRIMVSLNVEQTLIYKIKEE